MTHAPTPRSFLLPVLGIALLWPAAARARSDTHYQDYIVGERAAGMSGAFTALANEATGAHYNPAGIIAPGSTMIQLSMSAYKLRVLEVEAANLCGSGFDATENGFFSFPGSLGIVQQFSTGDVHHAVGLTLVVPFWDRNALSVVDRKVTCGSTSLDTCLSSVYMDRVFWGGLSYAIQPLSWLQLGVTFGVAVRSYTFTDLFVAAVDIPGLLPGLQFQSGEVTLWSLFVQLGAIVSPTDALRLGLSFTSPLVPIKSNGRLDIMVAQANPQDAGQTDRLVLDDVTYRWKVPFRLAVGAAYTFASAGVTLALDVSLHGRNDPYRVVEHAFLDNQTVFDEIPQNERSFVGNVAVGAEGKVHPKLTLRGGLHTNLSSYPDKDYNQEYPHVHRFGATVGVTYASNAYSALSLAVQAQLGDLRTEAEVFSVASDGQTVVSTSAEAHALDLTLVVSLGGSFDIR